MRQARNQLAWIVFAMALSAASASAEVYVVRPPARIQTAIDLALGNSDVQDTIFVREGTYPESLLIDFSGTGQKSLQLARQSLKSPLVSGGMTILDARLVSVIGLQFDSIHDDDLAAVNILNSTAITLSRCRGTPGDDIGVDVVDSVEVTIDRGSFGGMRRRSGGGGIGVRITGGCGHKVNDVNLERNSWYGLWLDAELSTVKECDISNNRGGENGGGLLIRGLRNSVSRCRVKNNEGTGIRALGVCSIRNTTVSGSHGDGIRFGEGQSEIFQGGVLKGNRVLDNGGTGILIRSDQEACDVAQNVVDGNGGTGIKIQSNANRISKNNCTKSGGSEAGHGIQISSSARQNCLERNSLSGNDGQGIQIGGDDNLLVGNKAKGDDGIVESSQASGNAGHANKTDTGKNDFP